MQKMKLPGTLQLTITVPEPAALLTALTGAGIRLTDVRLSDPVTLHCRVDRRSLSRVRIGAEKQGGSVRITGHTGLYWHLEGLLRRPVLVIGLLLCLLTALLIPTRIFFVEVDGNHAVPTRRILEAAGHCGLQFGSSRRALRSEQLKNHLLEQIPALQWAGVNTRGCIATITVRERSEGEPAPSGAPVSSIIAVRDCVILSCIARRGQLLCQPGQAVRKGEILISGLTDCGLYFRAEQAQGEVFGRTRREISVRIPGTATQKQEILQTKWRFALCIGKKRINFYKGSGNLPPGCDKICSDYRLTLPGGFTLPVRLIREQLIYHQTQSRSIGAKQAQAALEQAAQWELTRQMIAGRILQADPVFSEEAGCHVLEGSFICAELIGREHIEE